jgi:hypothetical protein
VLTPSHLIDNLANPESPLYSQWMTNEEVLAWVAPPAEITDRLISHLHRSCSGKLGRLPGTVYLII